MICMQGLYTNIQCAIAIIVLLFIVKKIDVPFRQLIFILLVFLGMFISDFISGNDARFIYEGLKIVLLLMGISTSELDDKKHLISGLYIGISVASFVGIIAYLFEINLYEIINSINGTKVLQGFWGYANTTALFCGIGIILAIYYISCRTDFRFLHEIALLINAIALMLTRSLFGYVCLFMSFTAMFYIKTKSSRKYIIIFSFVVFTIVIGMFLTGNEEIILRSTVASRLIYWYDALLVFIKNPFGIGVHAWEGIQYAVQTADYSVKCVHNGYIQLLLDGGIISFTGFVLLLIFGYIGLIKKYNEKNDDFYLYLTTMLTLIVLHSFVDINFAYGTVWFVIGLLLSCSKNEKNINNKIAMPIIAITIAIIAISVPEKEYINSYSIDYQQAYNKNDLGEMNKISAEWVKNAPRQQAAYDARYYVLDKLNDNQELLNLQIQKDKANNTMNFLCKYLTRHKEIVLPEVNGK